jgi:general stress protein 26
MNDNQDLRQEVWAHFRDFQPVFMATMDGRIPRVRPVTLIHFDKKMWVTTGSRDAKIRQIKANKSIEFCFLLGTSEKSGYVRCTGHAEIIRDSATRKLIADNTPFFKHFWKAADDPEYTLLRIHAKDVEYVRPGTFKAERFLID